MAQSGFTPISLYYTTTAAAVPTSGNLVAGELALNTNDGKLYYKNSSGVVTLLAGATAGPAGGSTTQVQYNNAGVLAGITGATTNGTALTLVAPVLGTPASGIVTNLTGTASININGTVGATTANTGAFTTINASGLVAMAGAATIGTTLGVTGTTTAAAINASGVLGITTNNIYMTQKDSGGTQRAIMGLGNDNNLYIGDLAGFSGGIKFGANGLYAMTLSSAGNVSMTGTLGVTGTTTAAAINASGTVAMAGAATVGTTLGVTGTSTMAAINASGKLTTSAADNFAFTSGGNVFKMPDGSGVSQTSDGVGYWFDAGGSRVSGMSVTTIGTILSFKANNAIGMTIAATGVSIPGTLGVTGILSANNNMLVNGASANGVFALLGRSGLDSMYVQRSNTAQSFGVGDDGNVYAGQIGASTGTALILSGGYIKTLTSSRRYKKDEEPIDIGLDFINTLKPIKFRLKENNLPQVGFIAEDFPDERLVDMSYIDIEKKELGMRPESVHYSQITAPLVKAVQELSAKVAALEAAR